MNKNNRDFIQLQKFLSDAMPDRWLSFANELSEAADILWKNEQKLLNEPMSINKNGRLESPKRNPDHYRPYILLCAFALENLLKGLLIIQDPKEMATGKLSRKIADHNLLTLVSNVSALKLNSSEKMVCQVTSDALQYWARYPVPKKYNHIKTPKKPDDIFHKTFLNLSYRLGRLIYDQIKNGWDVNIGPALIQMWSNKYED